MYADGCYSQRLHVSLEISRSKGHIPYWTDTDMALISAVDTKSSNNIINQNLAECKPRLQSVGEAEVWIGKKSGVATARSERQCQANRERIAALL
jgi:3'-phosphoadenosine 5'-phosphosulfate (PAPS) 3'-phosphatase